jgi:hypothetical protein
MLLRRSKIRRSVLSRLALATVLVASGALTGRPLQAVTPISDTVKIGSETKKTIGVVTGLEAGDVACYITLDDDKGVSFQELADFSICEKTSLVGQRVKLAYRIENVMADECQGNPDCTKSKKVALVISVKKLAAKPAKAAPQPAHR